MTNVFSARKRRRLHWGSYAVWFVLFCMALVFLMPVYVMIANGLKDAQSVSLQRMWLPPSQLSINNGFVGAWERLSPNLMNSLNMVIPATVLSSLLGAINGYLFAKWRFRGSDILFTLMLFGFFIPYQSILLPLVRTLQVLGLYGTIPGLVLVHVIYGIPITTLIFRNYFAGVPTELVDAARVDGAGVITTFIRVMLPLSIPAFVVVGIFQFTNIWNDFLFGVTVVPNPAAQPVTIALNNLSGTFSVEWNVVMAGAVVAALPTAIIYILLGRFFIRGILAGSVKG
ncbi:MULTISPECIES: carbohydrate ABC transporter permease [Caldilinea]|jgi:glucose/mannose transport system permease protein|uniref:Carbohydrate ABC transporter permease n=2 Tax=Caldilinea aerophila TaxID=133453 RepID=A0A7C1JI46_9CHLR|nr:MULTISPECIES: carbohydrate ABC transporter permease [Caldilinea]MBO9393094.1 carbohydrate ABC transporter permease [Caldilinea sp.]GIV71593.1 MAG: ABC transporter permease [Caldilinea sp.]